MDERPDSKRFYDSPITAKPIQWRTGDFLELSYADFIDHLSETNPSCSWIPFLSRFKVPDTCILVPKNDGKTITEEDLPTEFFNHDLMDVNAKDSKSVLEFCRKWGFPYSPQRFVHMEVTHKLKNARTRKEQEQGKSFFRSILISNFAMTAKQEQLYRFSSNVSIPETYSISLEEAGFAIHNLQFVTSSIRKGVKEGLNPSGFSYFLSPCSCSSYHSYPTPDMVSYGAEFGAIALLTDSEDSLFSPSVTSPDSPNSSGALQIWLYEHLSVKGTLTSAICNQILNTMADPTEWRTCKCEGCEVVFKHRYGRGNRRVHNDSVYCSQKCSERQKKRNQRAAAKNRIKH